MRHRRMLALLLPCLFLVAPRAPAQIAPNLQALWPLGGQQGTVLSVELTGSNLEGAYAVWFGAGTQLSAPQPPRPVFAAAWLPLGTSPQGATPFSIGSALLTGKALEPGPGARAAEFSRSAEGLQAQLRVLDKGVRGIVQLAIAPRARVGHHTLHLVGPGGLSNGLPFWVGPHAVIREIDQPHASAATAQPLPLPVAVSGRIPEKGELDYYRFQVGQEKTLAFEVVSFRGAHFDPQLTLLDSVGSWLDPHRGRRLLFHEELTQGGTPADRRLTYHFTRPGRYLVTVSSPFARGGADFAYLLRIGPADRPADAPDPTAWAQERLQTLRARTVEAQPVVAGGHPTATAGQHLDLVREKEPNDRPDQAAAFTVPAVLEGCISRPGDVDQYKFRASPGQKLVLEVETPRARPSLFNPRLDVLDASGRTVLSNIRIPDAKHSEVARQAVGTLEKGGEYRLRVRDITAVYGSPEHRYWILVRPQVPHVGDVRVGDGRPVNLVPGTARQLALAVTREEGYAGDFAVSVEGPPRGVEAFFSTAAPALVLLAAADAPPTRLPQMLRISGRPVVAGKAGPVRVVTEIPVMVTKK